MINPLKRSRRLLALAFVMALVLLSATTGLAHAASVKPQDVLPPSTCLSATPATQVVGVGQLAKVTIASRCPLPQQPVANASIVVAWGDGTLSRYVYCLEVCYVYVIASHTYQAVGDYHPLICMTVPTPTPGSIACTSVEIRVVAVPAT